MERVPSKPGQNLSVVAAMSASGIQVPMMLAGSMDALAFEAWIAQALVLVLAAGMVVFMDNLNFHVGARVRTLIEGAGGVLVYLLTYWLDLNAIEEASLPVRCVLGTRSDLEDQAGLAAVEASRRAGVAGGVGLCVEKRV